MQKAAKKDPEKARANSRIVKSPASAVLQISPLLIAVTSAAGESAIRRLQGQITVGQSGHPPNAIRVSLWLTPK